MCKFRKLWSFILLSQSSIWVTNKKPLFFFLVQGEKRIRRRKWENPSPPPYFNFFYFLLRENSLSDLWFHLFQCLRCALSGAGFYQDYILTGWWGPGCAWAFALQGENVFPPPFHFTPKPSGGRGICCSQLISVCQDLSFLWSHPLWMRKRGSTSVWPVRASSLIIHAKCFPLEKELGGTGGYADWPFWKWLSQSVAVAVGQQVWGDSEESLSKSRQDIVLARCVLEFICDNQKPTFYLSPL